MPLKVMDQIVAAGKYRSCFSSKINPFALTALHLHNVSHGEYTPEVGRVDLSGLRRHRAGGSSRRGSSGTLASLYESIAK
jgi:hypothetical protein